MTEHDRVECLAIETPAGRFAVETGRLRELVAIDELTPVPGSPESIAGITTVRGTVVVVISGQAVLDTTDELLLVFDRDDDRRPVGLAVGDVAGVELIELDALTTPESFAGTTPDGLALKAVALPIGRSTIGEPTFVIDTAELGRSSPVALSGVDS